MHSQVSESKDPGNLCEWHSQHESGCQTCEVWFVPLPKPNHNDLQLSSQVHNKRLTLSFGFAIQHVLLSLLGCNIIVQAVEKILLIVYFLAAVTRNNRQEGMSCNSYTLTWAVSINSLLCYKTQTYMLLKPNNKIITQKKSVRAQSSLFGDEIVSHLCGRQGRGLLLLLNSQQCLPLYLTHSPALFRSHAGYNNIILSKNDEWMGREGGRGIVTGITIIHNTFILQKHPPQAAF